MNSIGLDHISSTQLRSYEECPRLFYYQTFLGIYLPSPKIHLKFGSAIHLAVDNIYEQHDDTDTVTGWSLADKAIPRRIFKDNFLLEHVDPDVYINQQEMYDIMLADGLNIIDSFWDEKEILKAKGVLPTRMEMRYFQDMTLPGKEKIEIPIRCTIDGINEETNRVTEFKTSSKPYVPAETRRSLQALSYAAARYIQTGRIPQIDYVVMLKKKDGQRIQHVPIQYEEADLLDYDKRVRGILDRIRAREFDWPLKGHMGWCECKKYDELLRIEK